MKLLFAPEKTLFSSTSTDAYDMFDDDDEFRYNDMSTPEGHLHQNGVLAWFCNEMAIMMMLFQFFLY